MFLKALPLPPALKLFRNLEVVDEEDQLLLDLQKKITLQSEINRYFLINYRNHIENVLAVDRNLVELNKKALKEDNDSEYSEDSPDLIDDLDLEDNPIRNRSVVVQIDDEQDEDLILLLDPSFPDGFLNFNIGFQLSNIESSESVGFDYNLSTQQLQMITLVKQAVVNPAHHPNRQLSAMFKVLFQEIQLQLSYFSPCLISGINYSIQLPKENEVQIFMTAVAIGELALIEDVEPFNFEPSNFEPEDSQLNLSASTPSAASFVSGAASLIRKNLRQMTKSSIVTREIYEMASVASEDDIHPIESQDGLDQQPSRFSNASKSSQPDESAVMKTQDFVHQIAPTIDITPLPFVANKTIEQYIGRLSLHFVKEANLIFETGIGLAGMGGFSHSFLVDFYSVLRAHTCALGGNALISVSMDEHVFSESIKNQGYGILSVSGDVVKAVSPPTCDVATQELLEK